MHHSTGPSLTSTTLDRQLCLQALGMALEDRKPPAGCIHHSDRGVQYASAEYVFELKEHCLQISMSAKGNPYENAFVEAFMKTLKYAKANNRSGVAKWEDSGGRRRTPCLSPWSRTPCLSPWSRTPCLSPWGPVPVTMGTKLSWFARS
ncbi:MAG: DDE-type integrase/transposase/recombinase [Acidobacteria bacterium]|nr:DDE-type integrase/transposase/recombinase [Acidobacteriota bacterium]